MHPWIILAKRISSPWRRKRELPFDPWRRSLDPPALNASKIAPNCATLSASKRLGAGEDALAGLSHLSGGFVHSAEGSGRGILWFTQPGRGLLAKFGHSELSRFGVRGRFTLNSRAACYQGFEIGTRTRTQLDFQHHRDVSFRRSPAPGKCQ